MTRRGPVRARGAGGAGTPAPPQAEHALEERNIILTIVQCTLFKGNGFSQSLEM